MKVCNTCKVEKPFSEFYTDLRCKDKHVNKCKSCVRVYQKTWVSLNKDKKAKANSTWYYRTTHNITPEEFSERATAQNNKCVLCSVDLTFTSVTDTRAVMDHCHSTGVKRGILCYSCNLGLGKFRDNIQTLQNAVDYLKEHQN
jgi:hypothetical protein